LDNQISASCFTEFENGYGYMITEYLATCGCNWKVDMWGNVRAVRVCDRCRRVDFDELYDKGQLSLLDD
jgi:hypothetical protein